MSEFPRISYHNHSTWSDGTTSIEEMIQAAERSGLAEFGISDHFVLPPDHRRLDWSMPCDHVEKYIEQARSLARAASVTVRIGIEADYFPETFDEIRERLDPLALNYIIGAVHIVDGFPIDGAASYWQPLDQDAINSMHLKYWQRVAQMARTGFYSFAAHLDLPKKFAFYPSIDAEAAIAEALDALAAADMPVELNTAGWNKPCAEAYPSASILRQCRSRNIPVLLSADAHAPAEILQHFARGAELLRNIGYSASVTFAERRMDRQGARL